MIQGDEKEELAVFRQRETGRQVQGGGQGSVKVSGFCTTSIHFPISNIKVQNIIMIFPFYPISLKGFKAKFAQSLSLDIPMGGI